MSPNRTIKRHRTLSDLARTQYADSTNLRARADLCARFCEVDWFGWVAERLTFGQDACVLDVGCGPGWLWRRQAGNLPDGLTLTLADTSEGMLREAEKALSESTLVFDTRIADSVDLPFADNSFDAVLLMHMLYHLDDPELALIEAYRVLRPGGRVFVTTNTLENMQELTVLGAQAFGGQADDLGAARFSLDNAEWMMGSIFVDIRRYDLEEVLACTKPYIAINYLLSMPPGNAASSEQQVRLSELVQLATKQGNGILSITRRTGLVTGMKTNSTTTI